MRLLSVSSIAFCIDCVTSSAYNITSAFTFLAVRPIVCMRDVSERRNPSLSASNIATNDTSGRSSPSLNRFTPTTTSNFPSLRSLSISTRSIALNSECKYIPLRPSSFMYSLKSSASRLVNVVTSTRSFISALFLICCRRSLTWVFAGNILTIGSTSPVGLIICSTTLPLHLSISYSEGVAETNNTCLTIDSHSSKRKGLLSRAEGSLKPYFTRVSFRDLSPAYIPRI